MHGLQTSVATVPTERELSIISTDGRETSRRASLLVLSGPDAGEVIPLNKPEVIIGRSQYADITIDERALSQQHAKLVATERGHRIHDLGSTNGTFVNDTWTKVEDLAVGDHVRIGGTSFAYLLETDPTSAANREAGSRVTKAHRPPLATGVPGSQTRTIRRREDPQVITAPAAASADGIGWLLRWARFVRRRWIGMLLLAATGAVAGAVSYDFSRPPSVAQFEIDLVPGANDNPVEMQQRQTLEFFRSAPKSFERPQLIARSLKTTGSDDISPQQIRDVQNRLELRRSPGSRTLYRGAFEARSPQAALQYLDAHLDAYLEQEVADGLQVLEIEVETLQEKLQEAAEELDATEQSIAQFKRKHSEGLPEQAQQFYTRLFELDAQSAETASEVAKAAAAMQVGKKRLKSESPLIESRIQMARPYEDAISQTKRDLASARAAGKAQRHPDVIELEQELAKLEDLRDDVMARGTTKILKSKNPIYEGARQELHNARAAHKIAKTELARLGADRERIETIVEDLPSLQREHAELTRSYDATKAIHSNLLDKLNSSKIQLEMERAAATARFDVVSPPQVETPDPTRTRIVRGVAFGVGGLLLGILFGIARDVVAAVRKRAHEDTSSEPRVALAARGEHSPVRV